MKEETAAKEAIPEIEKDKEELWFLNYLNDCSLEDSRLNTLNVFDESKVTSTHSVKVIGECIFNEKEYLENTRATFAHLHPKGIPFHMGNFVERGRYKALVF